MLWSDESKFALFSDGPQWIRRPDGKRNDKNYMVPTVKHGGGTLMVWGSFIGGRVGPLHWIKGIMDAKMYAEILQEVMLLPWAVKNCQEG